MDRAEVARIIRGHHLATQEIRRQLVGQLQRLWDSLDDYRDEQIDQFAGRAASAVTGGQRNTVELEQAYLARLATAVRGEQVRPAGIDPRELVGSRLRGVEPREVYRRAGVDVWTALADGEPIGQAQRRGRRRALSTAQTDLQLARTHAARRLLPGDERVVGYRRATRGAETCDLCVTAAEQRYHTDQLMPIHPGCDCAIVPIYSDADPSDALDRPDRDPVDVAVREHGEIGAVLTHADHGFTGPENI